MKKPIFYILVVLCLSCTNPAPDTYTVEIKDGVRYVHNAAPKWGDDPKIKLEFVQKIGGLEIEDEDYQFETPVDVSVDSRRNIFILDFGNRVIKKFDSLGKYLSTIPNQKPKNGDELKPEYIQIDRDDNLFIKNSSRYDKYDNRGQFLNSVRSGVDTDYFVMRNDGLLIFPRILAKAFFKYVQDEPLAKMIKPDNTVVEFGKRKIFPDRSLLKSANYFYFTLDKSENIYFAFFLQNRIEKYSPDGKLIMQIDRILPFAETVLIKLTEAEQLKTANKNIFSHGIEIDHRNRMWVIAHKKQFTKDEISNSYNSANNIQHFEIYDNEGILTAYVENDLLRLIPFRIDRGGFRIFGDRLFLIGKIGNKAVYEYRIVEN